MNHKAESCPYRILKMAQEDDEMDHIDNNVRWEGDKTWVGR